MAILPPDPVFCFKGDMGHIHSLCFPAKFDNYCSQILAATEKGTVYFWDLETNRLQYKQQMGESIQAVHHFDDNIITQEKSGLVKLWSTKKSAYNIVHTYQAGGGFCKSIVLNSSLIVPQQGGVIDVLDINTLSKARQLVPDKDDLGMLMCLTEVEIAGNPYLLGGYETGDVILWDLNAGKASGHIKLQEQLTSITFDPVMNRAVCSAASSNVLQLFCIDKSLNMTLKAELSITNEGCNVVKMRPDRRLFVSGGLDGRLRVFSCKTLRILVVLAQHKGPVTDVQFSPGVINYWNSKIMAASGADGSITLWNIYNN
ncbi:hypothetical protein NQ315_002313 [Exocentrus adspersus]|uniref:Guanine nucleotide-binding protein subunit beta-like protein 1 n=1 Tax=Exocentrus adspersus TaxID=1586481 RepID=A0AAV8VT25_9CUCU|nr:hypothetical protein NQ315_002313 [Exocentrus adspersus]